MARDDKVVGVGTDAGTASSRRGPVLNGIARAGTIRVRLTLWYVLLLSIILVGFSAVLYLLLDSGLDNQVDNDLRAAAEQVRGAIALRNGQLVVQSTEGESELTPLGERGVLARVLAPDGTVIESVGPYSTLPVPQASLALAATGQGQPFFDQEDTAGGTPVRLYTLPYEQNGTIYGFIEVGQSLKSAQDTLHSLLLLLAVVVPGTLVLASAGGWFLANRAILPIDNITRLVRRISAEDLTQRLDLDLPDDEVGRLASTFDSMLDRLEEAFERQRRFTADASHELRTPLTIMKGEIGVALNRPRSASEYRRVLSELEEEVDRLTRLVEDLLLLARADTNRPLLSVEPVDLRHLLEKVLDRVGPVSSAKAQTVELQTPESIQVCGDASKLERLFLNLVDNAITYTQAGGRIVVRASAASSTPASVLIEVADNGPGMSADQVAHIFERFYRADLSRSSPGGAGLGLSIARWIAELHGGQIFVQSTLGRGSVFSVSLPVALLASHRSEHPAVSAEAADEGYELSASRSERVEP
jgi:two-component system, OmpR family, sensor kinase